MAKKTDVEKIEELAEEFGELYEGYSGRCMFGATCLGIMTDDPEGLKAKAKRRGLGHFSQDNMGLDWIIYWSSIDRPKVETQ